MASNPLLFEPITFRSVTAKNRIVLSPMCQYSGHEGMPNEWHYVHLAARASGGTGIVFTEVIHTEPRGRITPFCLGLWNDEQEAAYRRIAQFVSERGAVPAMQIGHAGRKASVTRPWEGITPIDPRDGGWVTVAPSPLPYAPNWPTPQALSTTDIADLHQRSRDAAERALRAGFRILELHAAHGYLGHQFLSPLTNQRTDAYGASPENRARFLLEEIDAVRSVWPHDLPLFVRISATDWVEGGLTLEDSIGLAKRVKATGQVDLIDCSSGGNDPGQKITVHPGYQVPFAQAIRQQAHIATGAVGLIHSPDLAESILANQQADLVFLGRTLLADPVWPIRAAQQLKAQNFQWPVQYERGKIFYS